MNAYLLLPLTLLLACLPKSPPGSDPLRAAAAATGWVREDGVGAEGPRSVWCRTPDPIVGCLALRLAPGAGWRILEAGRWEAAEVPAEGWGGQLMVAGSAWRLLLVRHAAGKETDRLELGRELQLSVEITDVTAPGGDFRGFTRAATVGEAICGRLSTLHEAAATELSAGRVQRCHYGRYTGDASIACRPVPLPPAEAEGWLRELVQDRLRHCDQAREDAAELAALLSQLWPGR